MRILLFLIAVPLMAQTVVGPRVYPNGTSDPATCIVGQWFMRTDLTSIKICTATNTWSSISGSGGTTNALQTLANLVVRTSSTVLTMFPSAAAGTPYNFAIDGAVYSFVTSPTVTITGGSGSDTVYLYVDSGGTLTAGKNNLTMTASGAITVVAGVTSFPEGSVPIATWTATTALWDASGGSNKLQLAGTTRVIAGSNCTVSGGIGAPYSITCAGGGGVSSASQTIGFAAVAAGGAVTSVEVALTSFAGISGDTRFGKVTVQEATQFSCGAATALTVSMGRTGANNSEMSGLLPLMQTSGNFYTFTPPEPQISSTYSLFLNFASTGANVSACTAGSLVVKVFYY